METLRGASLPAEVKDELARYLAAIAAREKRTHLDGRLSLGLQYDTNRNATPSSGQRLLFDIPFTVASPRDDTSLVFLADAAPYGNGVGGIPALNAAGTQMLCSTWDSPDPATQKADRVGVKVLDDGRRVRCYKSNGEVIDA